jgi:hypothetical protein
VTPQVERRKVTKFDSHRGDLKWGKFDYPVTKTQKATLDGLWYMMSGLPKAYDDDGLPQGGFYSQNEKTGAVTIGLHHRSVNVHRSGRITSNED